MHIHGYKKPFETDNLIEKINEKKDYFFFQVIYIIVSLDVKKTEFQWLLILLIND